MLLGNRQKIRKFKANMKSSFSYSKIILLILFFEVFLIKGNSFENHNNKEKLLSQVKNLINKNDSIKFLEEINLLNNEFSNGIPLDKILEFINPEFDRSSIKIGNSEGIKVRDFKLINKDHHYDTSIKNSSEIIQVIKKFEYDKRNNPIFEFSYNDSYNISKISIK